MLAGPVRAEEEVNGVAEARDRQAHYFREPGHSAHSDLDYLRAAIARLERYDATRALVNRQNPLHLIDISPDTATELLEFWRWIDPAGGRLVHDFTDETSSTRFLGDLYQDLSEQARKDYALLQTPEFVEEFILDRTLDPAIDEYGLAEIRMIDPTCGSGHFLLGAFRRLLDRWREQESGIDVKVHVERVLGQVHGVDINPFAVAIARFRLVIAALNACRITRLKDAPAWRIRIAIGDSLLWGIDDRQGEFDNIAAHALAGSSGEGEFVYEYENTRDLTDILGQRYHAVVGNPPYITVKDPVLNGAYRARWNACAGFYALSAPFAQRFFRLAIADGFTGQITSNSFMKREFGKKLIEQFFSTVDLTLIIDSSGVYVPGHGTPTILIFGRNRSPLAEKVRVVLGVRGEPEAPAEPARGLVWNDIVENVDRLGRETEFVSVAEMRRLKLAAHPWSLSGGGAGNLLELISAAGAGTISHLGASLGYVAISGADDAFVIGDSRAAVSRLGALQSSTLVTGEDLRDWRMKGLRAVFPYLPDLTPTLDAGGLRWLWPLRSGLRVRTEMDGQQLSHWFQYRRIIHYRYFSKYLIGWAEVATHNHFCLIRGCFVLNQTAPTIHLPAETDEEMWTGLLGLLNSSVGCFWLKQMCHDKGGQGVNEGFKSQAWERFYQFGATKLSAFPVPARAQPGPSRRLRILSQELNGLIERAISEVPRRNSLNAAREEWERIRAEMISAQEELDWEVYDLYGLLGDGADELIGQDVTKPPLALGERAFEIALARKRDAGEVETEWFTRHRSTPITELPAHWPDDYRTLVEHRLQKIADDPYLHLIERPECKRRWATRTWEEMEAEALRDWLLDKLEAYALWHRPGPAPRTVAQLADEMRSDADFTSVAALYARDADLGDVVAGLVKDQHVPFLAAWRYTETGRRVRAQWERTWDLQREQDAEDERIRAEEELRRSSDEPLPQAPGKKIIDIEVPPKYKQGDFRETSYWRNRGKLDVPKERFISYPDASRDGTLLLGWAGWDHLQQAQALATYIAERREVDAWDAGKITPLLAGLLELLPWVAQWHPDVDPEFGVRPAQAYTAFLDEQLVQLGLTRDKLTGWDPPARTTRKRATTKAARKPRKSAQP
jgi:hypothetical protein